MKPWGKDILMGFIVGSTMSVPGISGGTMAMALGYYTPMLKAVAHPTDRANLGFLLRLLCGGLCGFGIGVGIIGSMMDLLPLTGTLLFTGAILAGMGVLWKETAGKISARGLLFFLLGLLSVLAVEKIPPNSVESSPLLSILWGILLAAGLILPGISTSHLLTVFGLYPDLTDLSMQNLLQMIPLLMGAVIGTALLTKPLAYATERYPKECAFALLGFSAGSLKGLLAAGFTSPRWSSLLWFQIPNGLLLATAAASLIRRLGKEEKKLKNSPSAS